MPRAARQLPPLERIRACRQVCPELALRSTFLVGLPGELERDFGLLLDWLEEAGLDRVGRFKYENVAGAAANDPPGHGPEEVKDERWRRLMAARQELSPGDLVPALLEDAGEDDPWGRVQRHG